MIEADEDRLLGALKADPRDAAAGLALARLYIELGRPVDALWRLSSAADHLGADPALNDEACRLLLEIGDFDAAARQAARGLAMTGRFQLLAHHERALQRLAEDAAQGVSPALKRTYLKAQDRLARGRPDAAAELFLKTVRNAPGFAPGWIGLRGAYLAQGEADRAAAVGERWRSAAPRSQGVAATGMGRVLAANGLVFDPFAGAPIQPLSAAAPPVADADALARTPAGRLVLDPGGSEVVYDPVLQVPGDESERPVIRFLSAEVSITVLEHAALVGRGVVLTRDGAVVRELHGANPEKSGYVDRGDRAEFDAAMFQGGVGEVRVFDTPALLMTAATDKSYGDWMINFVPRLAAARAAGLDCPVVVSAKAPDAFIEVLRAFGLKDADLIRHDRHGVSLFPRLYVPSWPMREFLRPMAGLFDVYAQLPEPAGGEARRLYLSREGQGRRGLANEAQVRVLFEARGFAVVRPEEIGLDRMRALMAAADYVAAPYGSALLNLAYARRKPVAIVCMPPQKPGFLSQTALWLGAMGLKFAYVTGEPAPDAADFAAKDAPWIVSLAAVEAALDRALAEPRA